MSRNELALAAAAQRPYFGRSPWILAGLLMIGAGAFVGGLYMGLAQRAWQIFLVNLVFWTGLTCGMVMISAVLVITKANWGRPFKRLAEAPVYFLPLAFILFWLLWLGRDHLFPWIHEPIPEKAAWLNTGFFFLREGAILLLLSLSAAAMIFHSVRSDTHYLKSGAKRPEVLSANGHQRAQVIYANIYGIFFGVLLTILAFDLIMSLDPHWYSTLFGAYYFVGSFFTGIAALIITCILARKWWGLNDFITPFQMHNLGKLLLGFCLLTADFFFAQFFIMWYGNLPEETRFVLERVRSRPWEPLAYTVLIVAYALPFVVLLRRRIKMNPVIMFILCSVILAGMWLERFILIAPSIWPGPGLPLGLLEALITVGFLGAVGLCMVLFLNRYPLLPVSDPLFWQGLNRKH